MSRSTIIFLLILSILAGLLGYNYFAKPFNNLASESVEKTPTFTPTPTPTPTPSLIAELTPKEKVSQLLTYPLLLASEEASLSAQLQWVEQYQPGAVLLFGQNISTASASQAQRELSQIKFQHEQSPLLVVDHEGGLVQRLSGSGFTRLPSWKKLCQSELETRRNTLQQSAQELSAVGVDVILGPVVDLASSSGSLATRTCAADPDLVAARAQELIEIFKAEQILPVIKHFPGIGGVNLDLHHEFTNASLRPADLSVFKEVLSENSQLGVMATHVGVVGKYEDQPCSLNQDCLSDLTEYFTEALVISDALEMEAAGQGGLSLAERAVAAVEAGNHLLTFGAEVSTQDLSQVVTALENEYQADEEFAKQVKAAVEKLWRYHEL